MSGKPLVLQDPSAMPGHHLKCVPSPTSPRVPQPLLLISVPTALISPYFNCLLCRPGSSHELLWALRSVSAGLRHREHLYLLLLERGYVVGNASEHTGAPGLPSTGLKLGCYWLSPANCAGPGPCERLSYGSSHLLFWGLSI